MKTLKDGFLIRERAGDGGRVQEFCQGEVEVVLLPKACLVVGSQWLKPSSSSSPPSFVSCPLLLSCSLARLLSCAPPFTYCLFSELWTAGSQREVSWQWGGGEVCACVCVNQCVCKSVKAGGVWVSFAKSFSSWDSSAKRPLGYGLNFPFSPLLSLHHCCVQPWGRVKVGLLPTSCKRKPAQLQR